MLRTANNMHTHRRKFETAYKQQLCARTGQVLRTQSRSVERTPGAIAQSKAASDKETHVCKGTQCKVEGGKQHRDPPSAKSTARALSFVLVRETAVDVMKRGVQEQQQ